MQVTDSKIVFKGIRPLHKWGETARELALFNALPVLSLQKRTPDRLLMVPPDPWPGDAQRGRDMMMGVFRFAGQTVAGDILSWRPVEAGPEWVAELHGFEWLRDLRSVGGDRARRMARDMVDSWLDVYRRPADIVSRADVAGMRIVSWISFHDFFCASADDTFRRRYFDSLHRQARLLARVVPAGLSGLALMKALKGMAYAAVTLEGQRENLDRAFDMILAEIARQVLPDGTHVSRAPSMTFGFLQCLVDLRATLIAARVDMPAGIQAAIDRLAAAVKFFRHGDGTLCHFNGAQEGNAHLIDTTLMHSGARGRVPKSLSHARFERLQLGRSIVVMDTGLPVSSAYRHTAHAGVLSFEYTYGRDRIFVNCGSSCVAGRWREILRATPAHTGVTVEGRDCCPFNEAGQLSSCPEVAVKRDETAVQSGLCARHNGYMPHYGLTHYRNVYLSDSGEVLRGEDKISGKSGAGFTVRFHLHPRIQASVIQDGTAVLLRARGGAGWRFTAAGPVHIMLEDSVYGGDGEKPRRSLQIVLSGETAQPATTVQWQLVRERL